MGREGGKCESAEFPPPPTFQCQNIDRALHKTGLSKNYRTSLRSESLGKITWLRYLCALLCLA